MKVGLWWTGERQSGIAVANCKLSEGSQSAGRTVRLHSPIHSSAVASAANQNARRVDRTHPAWGVDFMCRTSARLAIVVNSKTYCEISTDTHIPVYGDCAPPENRIACHLTARRSPTLCGSSALRLQDEPLVRFLRHVALDDDVAAKDAAGVHGIHCCIPHFHPQQAAIVQAASRLLDGR